METRTGFLISRLSQVQGRVFQRLLQDSGVEEFNGPQGRILYVLWQEDALPIVAVARQTGLAKNTLTSMLSRMEAAGLIRREDSPSDRRSAVIRLTDRARGLEAKYQEVSRRMNEIFYRGLTQADAHRVDALLTLVLENLEEEERKLRTRKEKDDGED